MTLETKEKMEKLIVAAESGDESAVTRLRSVARMVADAAPTPCLIAPSKFIARSGFDQNVG
jgi:hypothetical protein